MFVVLGGLFELIVQKVFFECIIVWWAFYNTLVWRVLRVCAVFGGLFFGL